jgi:hypothetical protein
VAGIGGLEDLEGSRDEGGGVVHGSYCGETGLWQSSYRLSLILEPYLPSVSSQPPNYKLEIGAGVVWTGE